MRAVILTGAFGTLLFLTSAKPSLAQLATAPSEIQGWRGARWGMSLAQVLAAFPSEARRLDSAESSGKSIRGRGVTRAVIDSLVLEGLPLSVSFLFAGQSDSLVEVLIRRSDLESTTQSEHSYARLLGLLTSKYGQRSVSHEQRARTTSLWSFWFLRYTTLELEYHFSQFGEMISLWYRPHSPARGKV